MMRAEGIQSEADFLEDCTWFEYFWRQVKYKQYCDRVKESMKK